MANKTIFQGKETLPMKKFKDENDLSGQSNTHTGLFFNQPRRLTETN
jgi:hypothetical protein